MIHPILIFSLVNCVQLEIEKLKAENDRLKLENQGSRSGSQVSISSSPPPHVHGQASGAGSGLPQHSLNLTTSESTSLGRTEAHPRRGMKGRNRVCVCSLLGSDMLLDDTGGDGGMRKEGRHVKVVVGLDEDSKQTEVKPRLKIHSACFRSPQLEYFKPDFQLLSQTFRPSCLSGAVDLMWPLTLRETTDQGGEQDITIRLAISINHIPD